MKIIRAADITAMVLGGAFLAVLAIVFLAILWLWVGCYLDPIHGCP